MKTFNRVTKTFDESVVVPVTKIQSFDPVNLLKQEICGKYCLENIGNVVESNHGYGPRMHYIPISIYPDSCINAENLLRGVLKFVEKYKLTIIGSYYLNDKNTSFGIRVDEFGKRS